MVVERSELQLVWPPALFAAEARALLAAVADDDALGGLLAEAFHGGRGEQLLRQVADSQLPVPVPPVDSPWSSVTESLVRSAFSRRATARLVGELATAAADLPRYVFRPLFRERQQLTVAAVLSVAETKDRFVQLVTELSGLGYFEDAFGSECGDSHDTPNIQGQQALADRLDLHDVALWPLGTWSEGTAVLSGVHREWIDEVFFEVMEALDEVVARPRQRSWHGFHKEWDYSDYSRPVGQAVYRRRVNALLDRSDVPLSLAEDGKDVGLLVTSAGDARNDLVDRVLRTPDPTVRDLVVHAVSQFRSRDATTLAKHGATKHLADVLELRRGLLKRELFSGDEDDLFQIANRFQIRHLSEQQKGDYNPAFLDWVFWWYLGTIELTNKLLEQQAGQA
jgi:hypothetical protein